MKVLSVRDNKLVGLKSPYVCIECNYIPATNHFNGRILCSACAAALLLYKETIYEKD